jgi:hypothetical protein
VRQFGTATNKSWSSVFFFPLRCNNQQQKGRIIQLFVTRKQKRKLCKKLRVDDVFPTTKNVATNKSRSPTLALSSRCTNSDFSLLADRKEQLQKVVCRWLFDKTKMKLKRRSQAPCRWANRSVLKPARDSNPESPDGCVSCENLGELKYKNA